MNVQENVTTIQHKIAQACQKSGRKDADITIIAVTKYVSVERAEQAIDAGISNLGENRIEGFQEKWEVLNERADFHFIGTLQSRKVKDVIDEVSAIHSLDRISLAKEIDKRSDKPVSCFVQVNVSEEESKHGLTKEDVPSFIKKLRAYPNVKVVGLMTMAPHIDNEDELRSVFSALRHLKEEIEQQEWEHAPCHYLSMGMSNDYEIAIEEGATHIRIGSQLVGRENE
ncbi:YggS family pyridoxal phosphate-dependent enzyme [Pontibacillus salicampi]|uniref:Pyridoxal phosphate homeostasis protein n=1 Tax=Pontibacillus salicampi TaxID=1449801 RepID=A0ABV6LP37_9BACI